MVVRHEGVRVNASSASWKDARTPLVAAKVLGGSGSSRMAGDARIVSLAVDGGARISLMSENLVAARRNPRGCIGDFLQKTKARRISEAAASIG